MTHRAVEGQALHVELERRLTELATSTDADYGGPLRGLELGAVLLVFVGLPALIVWLFAPGV